MDEVDISMDEDDAVLNMLPVAKIMNHLATRTKNIIIIREESKEVEDNEIVIETKVFSHFDARAVESLEGNEAWLLLGILSQVMHNTLRGAQKKDEHEDRFLG